MPCGNPKTNELFIQALTYGAIGLESPLRRGAYFGLLRGA